MEEQVRISIDRYNKLMDMERGRIEFYIFGHGAEGHAKILEEKEAVKLVLEKNEILNNKASKLDGDVYAYKCLIRDLKKSSFFGISRKKLLRLIELYGL